MRGCYLLGCPRIASPLLPGVVLVWIVAVLWQTVSADSRLVAMEVGALEAGLDQPSAVALDDRGRAFVLDGVRGRVVVFDTQGRLDFQFGHSGGGEGELAMPMDLHISGGYLYVADTGNGRISVFNLRGEFKKNIELRGGTESGGRAVEPSSLTIDDDILSWSDRRNHQICRYDLEQSRSLGCWGRRGEGRSEFKFPFRLASDRDGYLHVVDVLNGRLQLFAPTGRYVLKIGRFGVDAGELFRPNALAFDEAGQLYVSDAYLGTVSIYRRGRFVQRLEDAGGRVVRFDVPIGMTVFGGRLYVVEAGGNRVSVVELAERPWVKGRDSLSVTVGEELSRKNCLVCHISWSGDHLLTEDGGEDVQPVASRAMCYSCHHGAVVDSRKLIGRGEQHPDLYHKRPRVDRGVDEGRQKRKDEIAAQFPRLASGQLSCGSCHTPHKFGAKGDVSGSPPDHNPWLRVENRDGDLCHRCHASKHEAVGDGEHPPKGVNHPVGRYLKKAPYEGAPNYVDDEALQKGLPEALKVAGATLGSRNKMICQTCHRVHGAATQALTPIEFGDDGLCVACHARQGARSEEEARRKGIHPVGIDLEEPVEIEGVEIDRITCLTCHSVHEGQSDTALLKQEVVDGTLCGNCHEGYDAVVGSDHDLRVTATKHENRFGVDVERAGACGTCHSMHRGKAGVPFLYAGEYLPYRGDEAPVLARDRICLDCHRKDGVAEKAPVDHFSHPARDVVLRSNPEQMPLVGEHEEIDEFGVIACITCHDPHRWRPRRKGEDEMFVADPGPPKNRQGSVLSSFLRRRGAAGSFCIDCHGLEARIKYIYFHDEVARQRKIDYLE